MKAWIRYAVASVLVVSVLTMGLWFVLARSDRNAMLLGAGLSCVIQLAAFAALLAFRDQPQLFLIGWGAGIGLRFLTIGVVAFVVTRTEVLPLEATLLSLVGFTVLLLFMEPLFLRRGPATK